MWRSQKNSTPNIHWNNELCKSDELIHVQFKCLFILHTQPVQCHSCSRYWQFNWLPPIAFFFLRPQKLPININNSWVLEYIYIHLAFKIQQNNTIYNKRYRLKSCIKETRSKEPTNILIHADKCKNNQQYRIETFSRTSFCH